MKIEIFVAFHKDCQDFVHVKNSLRKTILSGSIVNKKNVLEAYDYYDDVEDNISLKNPYYSELTALYWIWKNNKSEIIGLEHYRRYFIQRINILRYKPLKRRNIKRILKKYDLIVPKIVKLNKSIKENYINSHIKQDYDLLIDILKNDYPEYYHSALEYFESNQFYPANMFISSKETIDEYLSWLFSIFFKLESKLVNLDSRDDYQKRVFGFISERLFGLYIKTNNLKYYENRIFMLQDKHRPLYDTLLDIVPLKIIRIYSFLKREIFKINGKKI